MTLLCGDSRGTGPPAPTPGGRGQDRADGVAPFLLLALGQRCPLLPTQHTGSPFSSTAGTHAHHGPDLAPTETGKPHRGRK